MAIVLRASRARHRGARPYPPGPPTAGPGAANRGPQPASWLWALLDSLLDAADLLDLLVSGAWLP